ncbi:MAG TPA: CAP domain-containing protein, partial [Acidimicrobiia bacterium]
MRKVVFGLIVALGVSLFPAGAHADTVSDEASFVAKINDLRISKGLPALEVNANLVAKARGWAAGMAAAGRIWHSTLSDGITADWQKLGENVGMGGSVEGLHAAFVASPHHYENLVDPDFGYVGIGIVTSSTGTMFV